MASEILGGFVKDAFPELFVEGQVVSAEQSFHRRLAEYEMNIEQQKLFREDLRDLVELTVGRMDVYHLVGALLLEFCIHFYCENLMIEGARESDTKAFVVVFFLIANLSAVGFLVFSVWLSMHASVASHSIGVRLLTSFARLSIPTRKELEEVAKAPLVPMVERFRMLGKRLGMAQARAEAEAAQSQSSEAAQQQEALRRETAQLARAAAGLSTTVATASDSALAIQEGAKALFDREYHFRRFLKEQRRWLFYDAYARVCMALGINQMLQALSYYIVGGIAEETPSGAALSLVGVQVLSLLLLRLDMAEGLQHWSGAFAVIVFMALPPLYIGILIHFVPTVSVRTVEFFALPAFLLHSMWMLLIAAYLVPDTVDEGLPKTLRTVLYLDVLHLDQQEMAEGAAAQQVKDTTEALQEAQEALKQAMRGVLEHEATAGNVSSTGRQGEQLQQLEAQLRAEVVEAREQDLTAPSSSTRQGIRRAERTLDHFTLWKAAPEINANLSALSNPAVESWLSEKQREEIKSAYQHFLARCQELDLGICTSSLSEDEDARRTNRLSAMEVASSERPMVRVDASSVLGARGGYGYDDQQVYIDSRGHVNHEAPAEAVTSFDGTFTTDLPQWNQSALRLMQADSSPAANEECQIAERRQRSRPRLQRAMTRRERRLERTLSGQPYHVMDTARAVVQAGSSLLPASALPPHALPGVLVRRYTFLISFLWIVSGVMHGIRWTSNHVIIADEPPTLVGSALRVSWPKPQHLFEVNALSCNSSHHVSVTNRFGRFQGLLRGDIAFEEMPEEPPGLLEDLHLKIPSEWPLWCAQPCKGCEHTERWVAGWTGEEIFVGVARNSSIRIRYALRASFASCRGTSAWPKTAAIFGSCSISVSEENYTDVQALHMMNGAQLLVLHRGSLLDAWDLREGILLGRFSLPGASPAAAFCILQESLAPHLLLARRSKSRMGSPTLEMLSLPALWPASCQDPGGCSSQPAEEEGSSTESTKSDGESENLIS